MSISSHRRVGLLVVAALMSLGLLGAAVPAYAASGGTGHTVTSTDNFHGTMSFQDFNPCTGNLLNIDTTSNIVEHVTFFPAGDQVWATARWATSPSRPTARRPPRSRSPRPPAGRSPTV